MEQQAEVLHLKVYKKRLLLGEGDFSYTYALLLKHLERKPDLGSAIVATAYESEDVLRNKYPDTFDKHLQFLRERGVRVLFQVDATQLHNHPLLKDMQFDSIHFNFPHDGSSYDTGILRGIVGAFYQSARLLQPIGGRIYMALPKPPDSGLNRYRKVKAYDLYTNTRNAGYRLAIKREFNIGRYPAYSHVQTNKNKSAPVAMEFSKEYIFEKTNLSAQEILQINPQHDNQMIPEIKTDGSSTDYYFLDRKGDRLYSISSPTHAKEWIDELRRKYKLYLERIKGKSEVEPEKISEFFKKLHSLELYLLGSPSHQYYTHNSGLEWKNHVMLWYFRALHEPIQATDPNDPNNQLKYAFIHLLNDIAGSTPSSHGYFSMHALAALFYFTEYQKIKIINVALGILERKDANWHSKAVAISILIRNRHDASFVEGTLIPKLFASLDYDPRLDWMICSLLGKFDLARFLANPKYKAYFDAIPDLRLTYLMLKNSTPNHFPNDNCQLVCDYIGAEKLERELTTMQQLVADATYIPHVFSLSFLRNLITYEITLTPTSLIHNIFMPANSFITSPTGNRTLLTRLKDQHQIISFMKLGHRYLTGTHGCEKSPRKALNNFKIAADTGDSEALYQIVRLCGQGLIDLGQENLPDYDLHCIKLQKVLSLGADQRSDVFTCRSLILILQNNLMGAGIALQQALQLTPKNPYTLFLKAFLHCLSDQLPEAQACLISIRDGNIDYRNTLLYLIQHWNGDLEAHKKLLRTLSQAPSEKQNFMALICGMICFKLNREDRGQAYFRRVLDSYPEHPMAQSFYQQLVPDYQPVVIKKTGKFELIFKCFATRIEYFKEKEYLTLRANNVTGFVVCIGGLSDTIELLFVDVARKIPMTAPELIDCARQLLHAQEIEDQALMHQQMQILHQYVTQHFLKDIPSTPSRDLDAIESLQIIDTPDDVPNRPAETPAPAQAHPSDNNVASDEEEIPLDPEEDSLRLNP